MDQVQRMLEGMMSWANTIWHLELFKSGNNTILFNQIFIAVIHLLVGFAVSKKLSVILSKKIVKIGKIDEGTAHLIQRIIYFSLLVLFVLVAMPIAGIPIAALTILGSAFAIGIGFGAQNLFNNLISSIIIMMEKPIRVGDILVLGDTEGRVADIGNRCVRVRRGDGVDVIVPNSHFLEQLVVNWTLSDRDMRGELKVGVAYGSSAAKVKELLEQAALENENIHKQPAPFVLFEDFGDNALMFSLMFWSRVLQPLDVRRISSALRFRIDELFHEDGIVIAFPQRDIHLDSVKPLEVKLLKEETC